MFYFETLIHAMLDQASERLSSTVRDLAWSRDRYDKIWKNENETNFAGKD